VIGDKGIIFHQSLHHQDGRSAAVMLFKDGKTTPVPVEGVEWHDSFIAPPRILLASSKVGGQPRLDGPTGKAVLQFTAGSPAVGCTGKEVRPDDVK